MANMNIDVLSISFWVLFYYPPDFNHLHRTRSRWQEVKSIDFVGIVLFTGGLLIFLMGLSWGGILYPWKSAHVIGTIVAGFSTIVAFVLYGTVPPCPDPAITQH